MRSSLDPGAHAGTHKLAGDSIGFVGAERRFADRPGPGTMRVISTVESEESAVRGCAGKTAEDHNAPLRNMRFSYPALMRERTSTRAELEGGPGR